LENKFHHKLFGQSHNHFQNPHLLSLPDETHRGDTIRKIKQVKAISPNVIHSFDASHVVNVITKIIDDVITIHDSFGTHPNNCYLLIDIIRNTFEKMYSDYNYLIQFHNANIQQLKLYSPMAAIGEIKDNYVMTDDENPLPLLKLPDYFTEPTGYLNSLSGEFVPDEIHREHPINLRDGAIAESIHKVKY
jgi:hypothetical protein